MDSKFLSGILPQNVIKVAFVDNEGKRINGLTVDDARKVHQADPTRKFYFQNGDGVESVLTFAEVEKLVPADTIPKAPTCPTSPQFCGPPLVQFFGGDGWGATANAIISPISSSVIGFDIVNPGYGYQTTPSAELIDPCGKGSGAKLIVNMKTETGIGTTVVNTGTGTTVVPIESSLPKAGDGINTKGLQVKNITITATGDGFIPAPDGSLGGNERVWKDADEGFVTTKDGKYYVVQVDRPIPVKEGDTYYPPDGPPVVIDEDTIITLPLVPVPKPKPEVIGPQYPVLLCIEEIVVLDGGFGYRPGDKLIITPNNGTVAEPVINERGQIEKINIITGGCGYEDFPEIVTDSQTGFNGTFTPIFKVTPVDPSLPLEEQVIGPDGVTGVAGPDGKIIVRDTTVSINDLKKQTPSTTVPIVDGKIYKPFSVPEGASVVQVVDCVGRTFK